MATGGRHARREARPRAAAGSHGPSTAPGAAAPPDRPAPGPAPRQRSFDDLGTPLHQVTFCVVDLETTGGSPADCEITEVGAVKVRGGEVLGSLQTLVNPGTDIPPAITVLTGITEAMVLPAPRIDEVLPSFVEFLGDAVVVGHNVRFDVSFLQAALDRTGRPRLTNPVVDTCALARRLVRDEVPNCRLGTLAERLRLDHRPTHRALDDVLATVDLLHLLLERAAGLGVTGLDDLLGLPKMGGHPQARKLALTTTLPRAPGVYLFRDRAGRVLYVGKAANLRQRVRSYFSSDDRRKVGNLLREAHRLDHEVCANQLEAAVREVRLIHEHQPRYNRQAKDWSRYRYVKLTLDEPFPRLAVVRRARADGGVYLGPVSSTAVARRIVEAIETAVPLRRCTGRVGAATREAPCAPAQLGVAACPCAGTISRRDYDGIVDQARRGLTTEPELLLDPLRRRMLALADAERFEEAAATRDRAGALVTALQRQRRLQALRRTARLVVDLPGHGGAELHHGVLVDAWPDDPTRAPGGAGRLPLDLLAADCTAVELDPTLLDDEPPPVPADLVDELACVARWIDAAAARLRLVACDGVLATPLPALPSFTPAGA